VNFGESYSGVFVKLCFRMSRSDRSPKCLRVVDPKEGTWIVDLRRDTWRTKIHSIGQMLDQGGQMSEDPTLLKDSLQRFMVC
jgi:hypothetical protein